MASLWRALASPAKTQHLCVPIPKLQWGKGYLPWIPCHRQKGTERWKPQMQGWLFALLARQTVLVGIESSNSILSSKWINLILNYQGKAFLLRRKKNLWRNQIGTLKGPKVRTTISMSFLRVFHSPLPFNNITCHNHPSNLFQYLLSPIWIVVLGFFSLYFNAFFWYFLLQFSSLIPVPTCAGIGLSVSIILLFTAAFSVFEDFCNFSSGLWFPKQSKLFQAAF